MSFTQTLESSKFLKPSQVDRLVAILSSAYKEAIMEKKSFTTIRDYFIILTLIQTGIRRAELSAIKIEDINLNSNQLTIVNGKGGKLRVIDITPDTRNLIDKFLELKVSLLNEPIDPESYLFMTTHFRSYNPNSVYKRVKHWFKKAGIPDHLATHSLRHTHCSTLLEAGLPVHKVMEQMGHSSIKTTMVYTHVTRSGIPDIKFYNC